MPHATGPGRQVPVERHEHLDQPEVDVGVEQDRHHVDGQEDDGGATEEAVQVEQPGRPRPPSHARVLSASPHSTLAASSAHVTMPAARAVYQRSVL